MERRQRLTFPACIALLAAALVGGRLVPAEAAPVPSTAGMTPRLHTPTTRPLSQLPAHLPLSFELNRGQAPSQARFLLHTSGAELALE